MSSAFEQLTNATLQNRSADVLRAAAVASALQLILGKASNSPEDAVVLKNEMENLQLYADQIESALKVK